MSTDIMVKNEFYKLSESQQHELLEKWRQEHTDKYIFQNMKMGSQAYYKLVKALNCSPKNHNPSSNKEIASLDVDAEVKDAPEEIVEESTIQSVTLALKDTVNKERANILFQNVVNFLGDGEYRIKIEVSK